MKITTNTLTLMRHSVGAVISAAAISAEAYAGSPAATATAGAMLSDLPSASETTTHAGNVEQPEKSEEEQKKEEQKKVERRDPCPNCGLG
jgi:hypothetical protein